MRVRQIRQGQARLCAGDGRDRARQADAQERPPVQHSGAVDRRRAPLLQAAKSGRQDLPQAPPRQAPETAAPEDQGHDQVHPVALTARGGVALIAERVGLALRGTRYEVRALLNQMLEHYACIERTGPSLPWPTPEPKLTVDALRGYRQVPIRLQPCEPPRSRGDPSSALQPALWPCWRARRGSIRS
jgi:hypothetical protein